MNCCVPVKAFWSRALLSTCCGSGSSGGPRPSVAPYVTGMEPTGGAIAAGGC
jgi:hypothetical protein